MILLDEERIKEWGKWALAHHAAIVNSLGWVYSTYPKSITKAELEALNARPEINPKPLNFSKLGYRENNPPPRDPDAESY